MFTGHVDRKPARGIQYKMQTFMGTCVEAYKKVVGKPQLHLPRVDTPFLADVGGGNAPTPKEDVWRHFPHQKAWCRSHNQPRCMLFDPFDAPGGPAFRDLLPNRITRRRPSGQRGPGGGDAPGPEPCASVTDLWSNPRVTHRVHDLWTGETWFFEKGCTHTVPAYPIDLMPANPDGDEGGELADDAANVLLGLQYGARMGRWDLLHAVSSLTRYLTKWTKACDRALVRLMCYIKCTAATALAGYTGDPPAELKLWLYANADFAGDKDTRRSTSGTFLAIVGPQSFMPPAAKTNKQSCVSHSTPEAEIVSIDMAIRTLGIPALHVWDLVLGRSVGLDIMEDNDATILIMNLEVQRTLF
jgi:hypothetical protein